MRRVLFVVPLVVGVWTTGCSLEQGGTLASDAGTDATLDVTVLTDATVTDGPDPDAVVSVPDANDDAPMVDAGPCTTPASACASVLLPWKVVLFEPTTALGCPATWPKTDLAITPLPETGACSCKCSATNPLCLPAAITITDGSNAQCGGGGTIAPAYAAPCTNATFDSKSYLKIGKVTPVGGTCTPAVVTDSGKVSFTTSRTCGAIPACAGDVCKGTVPAGFSACIAAPGDLPCTTPGFQGAKYLVGTGASVTCDLGTCDCTKNPSCGGSVDFFSQANCATKTTTAPADDNCNQATFQNGSTIQSMKYVGAQPNAGCGATGAGAPKVALTKIQTICCK